MLSSDERLNDLIKIFHKSPHKSMHHFISVDQWNAHWSYCEEKTASSISLLHYGHYKIQSNSKLVSFANYHLVNLAINNGPPLERWKRGVPVMLGKSPENFLVEKLRSILLPEADFNAFHKIKFNSRLIPLLKSSDTMPYKIIGGRRSQDSTHLALSKKLIADISNTRKLPTATICADATNVYDRAAHPHASMCTKYFGMDIKYLQVLFFNHTKYEDGHTHSFWGIHFLLC